jgi:hypothetical protein
MTNLPILPVKQGYIESRAFSVYLNNDNGSGGQVLFGGVDTEKYLGDLVSPPLVPESGSTITNQFFVTLNGIQYTDLDGNVIAFPETVDQYPVPALLDTGTSNMVLPQIITSSIYAALNPDLSSPPDAYVDCSLAFTSATIDYMFDGITINVRLSQLITPNGPGRPFTECPLNFQTVSAGEPVVLGDSFLSSAYVVFDLDNG